LREGEPVNRLISFPLQPTAAEKVWFGDDLLRAIQSSFVLSAIARPLAAGYLRSIDPIAIFAQHAFSVLGLRRAERSVWEFRLGWRQWFEDKACAMARDRVLESIEVVLGFYEDMGYLLRRNSKDRLYSRLMNALAEDKAFIAEMAELQKLPVGRSALQRRLLALDVGVEKHMAALAHDMVMTRAAFGGVAFGGVQ
jgi:hypothetical protein